MRASNLARNFLDDLCPEPPKGSQPFKAAHPIFGSQEVLFHRPNENAQGRHEPNPKDLAGPDCIPVVGGDDGRLPFFQSKRQRFGFPGAQPEVLNEASDDSGLPDLLDGEAALLESLLDENAVGSVQGTRGLGLDSSRHEGDAREVVQEEVEQIRLCQQNQRRGVEDHHAGQCMTLV